MDPKTLAAYDEQGAQYADEWHAQAPPTDLYAVLAQYFAPGITADVGSGSGRDAGWLTAQGFSVVGYEPSGVLLSEARRRYPHIPFRPAALPEMAGVPSGGFQNVLCETVIMHLPRPQIPAAVRRLCELLAPAGTLYLSWRVTEGSDHRDGQGRLYTAFPPELVWDALRGADILHDEEVVSASSGRRVHRLVARRAPVRDSEARQAPEESGR